MLEVSLAIRQRLRGDAFNRPVVSLAAFETVGYIRVVDVPFGLTLFHTNTRKPECNNVLALPENLFGKISFNGTFKLYI